MISRTSRTPRSRRDPRHGLPGRGFRALAGALFAGLALGGCAAEPREPAAAAPPRSLVLLTLDTTRADRLEPYGAAAGASPALAELARQGVTFDRATAVSPLTLPTHATLLTGLYPPQHGLRNNGSHHLPPAIPTLAERLRERGLRTAAFVSAAVLERRYGLDRGFEVYDDDLAGGRREARMVVERPAGATIDAASDWLDGLAAGEPFFLWIHLFDPHAAYAPPAPWAERFAEPYAAEIAYMDAEIGRLLAHPRLAPASTAVAAIADHGESLGEHGEQTHGILAYEATLRIPWILRAPGAPAGGRVGRPASQVDLVPTVLELFGLPAEPALPGATVLDRAGDPAAPQARPLYAESLMPYFAYGWARLRVLREGDWKYIEAPAPELYDLAADPREQENVFAARPEGRAMAHRLRELVDELGETEAATAGGAGEGDAADAERLRALGYVAGAGGRRRQGSAPRPDPKLVIELHDLLQQAGELIGAGDLAAAETLLRQVRARDPGNLKMLDDLAQVLVAAGRREEARAVLEEALELAPDAPSFNLRLAALEAERGRLERALERARAARDHDPRNLQPWLLMADYLARLGRGTELEELYREAREVLDDEPRLHAGFSGRLAAAALERGDWAAARRLAERAVDLAPEDAGAWNSLGFALDELGRPQEAAAAWQRALAADPGYWPASHNLGLARLAAGDSRAAADAFEAVLDRRPGHVDSHFQLTLLYAGPLADPRRSLRHLEACLDNAPDHPRAPQLAELRRRLRAALAEGGG